MPSGLLPALEYKGKLLVESAAIMALLEDEFPDFSPLLPAYGTPERQRADRLLRLERLLFSDWLQWLCQSWYGFFQQLHGFDFHVQQSMVLNAFIPI